MLSLQIAFSTGIIFQCAILLYSFINQQRAKKIQQQMECEGEGEKQYQIQIKSNEDNEFSSPPQKYIKLNSEQSLPNTPFFVRNDNVKKINKIERDNTEFKLEKLEEEIVQKKIGLNFRRKLNEKLKNNQQQIVIKPVIQTQKENNNQDGDDGDLMDLKKIWLHAAKQQQKTQKQIRRLNVIRNQEILENQNIEAFEKKYRQVLGDQIEQNDIKKQDDILDISFSTKEKEGSRQVNLVKEEDDETNGIFMDKMPILILNKIETQDNQQIQTDDQQQSDLLDNQRVRKEGAIIQNEEIKQASEQIPSSLFGAFKQLKKTTSYSNLQQVNLQVGMND